MSEELNPYQPPLSAAPTPLPLARNRRAGCVRGSLGCGCFVPLVLFLIAGISGDIGGPLLWPLLVVVGTLAGAIIGTMCAPQERAQPAQSKPRAPKAHLDL